MSNLLFKYLFSTTDYNNGNGMVLNDTSDNDDDATFYSTGGSSSTSFGNNAEWVTNDSPFSANIIGTGLYGGSPYSFRMRENDNTSRYRHFKHTLSAANSLSNHSFTICIWGKCTDSSPEKHSSIFASSEENNYTTFQIGFKTISGTSTWCVICETGNTHKSFFPINAYTQNQWAHIAVTYLYDATLSNRILKTYFNGSLTNTYTSSSATNNALLSANTFIIERYIIGANRNENNHFHGLVSSARGYDRVLTPTEISNIKTYNSITGVSTSASAAGDPHIATLDGIYYKFNYIGAFRLFDNNHPMPNKRIVINAYSDWGDGRWSNQQYIRKIYIFCGNNELLVDTGFRGQYANILDNVGFNPVIKNLGFNPSAKNYCFNCKKKVKNNPDDFAKLQAHCIKNCHTCKPMVRNTINLLLRSSKVEQYMINISNANRFNLQPCRVNIMPIDIPLHIQNKWSGCVVDRKYSLTSLLHNIKAIHPISNPIIIDRIGPIFSTADLPPIEKQPSQINSEFY
jgi:hypothetical protein